MNIRKSLYRNYNHIIRGLITNSEEMEVLPNWLIYILEDSGSKTHSAIGTCRSRHVYIMAKKKGCIRATVVVNDDHLAL